MIRLAKFVTLLISAFTVSFAQANEPVRREERDLIAIVNLSEKAAKYVALYKYEEKRAAKKIRRDLRKHYRKIHLFEKGEATRENLLRAILEAENDPAVKATDVIIYVHGVPSMVGFVDGYYSSSLLAADILRLETAEGGAPRKLRALYSDACYGETHNSDWLKAGFLAVSGSLGVDSNWSVDLRNFMRNWRRGGNFEEGVHRANSVWTGGLTDRIIDGNSRKIMDGEGSITIETPVL